METASSAWAFKKGSKMDQEKLDADAAATAANDDKEKTGAEKMSAAMLTGFAAALSLY